MTEKQIVFAVAAAILTVLLVGLFYSLSMQKRAMGTQGTAVSSIVAMRAAAEHVKLSPGLAVDVSALRGLIRTDDPDLKRQLDAGA